MLPALGRSVELRVQLREQILTRVEGFAPEVLP
jgi:hypothetical protein